MPEKPRWNTAAVVERAGQLADRLGLDAVNLSRLADDLGVRPPSLFNHLHGIDDLLRLVALSAFGSLVERLVAASSGGTEPLSRYLALMTAYRAFVLEHPGRYQALARVPAATIHSDPEFLALEVRLLDHSTALAAALGWPPTDQVHAARLWRAFGHGFAELESRGGFGLPADVDHSFHRGALLLARP